MSSFKTLAAVTTLALITACAGPDGPGTMSSAKADEHASHHPGAVPAGPAATMPAMQDRMRAMREMHDKMMNAKTPAERQALMADHMKSMQDGMEMMKSMGGMGTMSADMGKRHQMMEGREEMMQMMMEMMTQRMPNPPSSK